MDKTYQGGFLRLSYGYIIIRIDCDKINNQSDRSVFFMNFNLYSKISIRTFPKSLWYELQPLQPFVRWKFAFQKVWKFC